MIRNILNNLLKFYYSKYTNSYPDEVINYDEFKKKVRKNEIQLNYLCENDRELILMYRDYYYDNL
jgi:hypothetical protein